MTIPDAATEALAEALLKTASDRKNFKRGKNSKRGYYRRIYECAVWDAEDARDGLKARGYVIRKARKSG